MKHSRFQLKQILQAIGCMLLLSLGACGGGSSDSTPISDGTATPQPTTPPTTPPAAPTTQTLTGTVVVDSAVRNAVVCMDLNANAVCDAGEAASAKTGEDGAYSLSYDPAVVTASQVAGASLIARMVPGPVNDPNAAIDAADPAQSLTASPYVLRQVAGKSGQINPLTTLVQAGIAGGMTEASARANVTSQLGISGAKIDNYQDDPAFSETLLRENARLAAKVTAQALEEGVDIMVGDQQAAVSATANDLRSLRYIDSANYRYLTFTVLAKPAGTTGLLLSDDRLGKTAGVVTAASALYDQAYLTAAGWLRCDASVPLQAHLGTPIRSVFCNAEPSLGFVKTTSVAGRTMASVVSEMRLDSQTNIINNGISNDALLTALGSSAVFPSDSAINQRTTLKAAQPIFINSISADGRPQSEATTLEQLIAAKPASGVVLATGGRSLTLGLATGAQNNLRAAFTGITSPTTGTVQYYQCDLNEALTVASNCVATQTGTYAITTVGGVRVMRFSGHAETVANDVSSYAEVKDAPGVASGNWVYRVREAKPSVDTRVKRLNATAWAAMKAQLGL